MKGNWMKPQLWIAAAAITVLLGLLLSQNGTGGVASRQEERMAEVLSAIAGAGRVEVALYYAQETDAFSAAAGAVLDAETLEQGRLHGALVLLAANVA